MDRFWSKVDKRGPNECWQWAGDCTGHGGYGRFYVNGRKHRRAHRVAYELSKGEIPSGLVVRHTCDNPPCRNPQHLVVGTVTDNNRDTVERGRHNAPCLKFFGQSNGRTKLSDETVEAIRASLEPASVLAVRYGISRGHVGHVRRGTRRQPIHSALPRADASAISPASGTARSDSAPSADRAILPSWRVSEQNASQAATAANSPAVEA
jgi:hypothetical protein